MPILRDLSHLVRGSVPHQYADKPPAPPKIDDPVLRSVVATINTRLFDDAHRDMADQAVLRASDVALDCDRAVQYAMTRTPATNPPTVADLYRFNVGRLVHDWVESGGWPAGAEHEPPFTWYATDDAGEEYALVAGHGDTLAEGWAYEFKTVNGTTFKRSIEEGPSDGHVRQLAAAAIAHGAKGGTIVYVATELVSVAKAGKLGISDFDRFLRAWAYDRATLDHIWGEEEDHLVAILEATTLGRLVARKVGRPVVAGQTRSQAIVNDPATGKGRLVRDGQVTSTPMSVWQCGYCRWQGRCISHAGATHDAAFLAPLP